MMFASEPESESLGVAAVGPGTENVRRKRVLICASPGPPRLLVSLTFCRTSGEEVSGLPTVESEVSSAARPICMGSESLLGVLAGGVNDLERAGRRGA